MRECGHHVCVAEKTVETLILLRRGTRIFDLRVGS